MAQRRYVNTLRSTAAASVVTSLIPLLLPCPAVHAASFPSKGAKKARGEFRRYTILARFWLPGRIRFVRLRNSHGFR
jgi:hypothetical protein